MADLDEILPSKSRRCRRRIKFDRFLFLRSCSQRRMTAQPVLRRYRETVRSRFRLFAILVDQNSTLDLGIRPCSGQPCQKHPSTNRTVRHFRNTKSGFPKSFGCRRHPTILPRRKISISVSSVLLFPFARTRAICSDRARLGATTSGAKGVAELGMQRDKIDNCRGVLIQ